MRQTNSVVVDICSAAASAISDEKLLNPARFGHRAEMQPMRRSKDAKTEMPISDQILRGIVERGFFDAQGSLADARAACAELMFAREIIKAQTMRIAQLKSDLMGD
jgi:hypothetical protein